MIRKIAIYAFVLILLLYSLQWFVNEGRRRNPKGVYEKYATIFLKNNSYNTLVLGSSRAEMHFDVSLFDSLTGLHSFNAGVSGGTTRMAYVILKSYLQHSKLPETVFLECDFHISHLKTDTIFNFPRYFPFLSNRVLYRGFKEIDPRFGQFKYNPFCSLPYSGIHGLSTALRGWTGKSGSDDEAYKNGFYKNPVGHYDHYYTASYYGSIHPENRHYLDSIIVFCKDNHCRLIFTMSPVYKDARKEMVNREYIITQYRNIAERSHIPFFNYSTDSSICGHNTFFDDDYHMLYSGARLYTRKIASDFNNIVP
ncbi:MAG: hypothetical protein V4506_06340 [Bacteroidota bacterium]